MIPILNDLHKTATIRLIWSVKVEAPRTAVRMLSIFQSSRKLGLAYFKAILLWPKFQAF